MEGTAAKVTFEGNPLTLTGSLPKVGEPAPDFALQGARVHGVPGLVHLFGIESPGLTASLALAGMVLNELR